jgi:fructose-1,6-bisphosphatase II
MEKLVVDRAAADALVPECLDAPAAWTLALLSRVKGKAVRALGGAMLGRLAPQSDDERDALDDAGIDATRILTAPDIVRGDEVVFAATGITAGPVLDGVRYHGDRADTQSLILRADTRSRRLVFAEHTL